MKTFTKVELIELAHQYYPAGFPVEEDDYNAPDLAHHCTPEHKRWQAAWKRAMEWKEWQALLDELRVAFPGKMIGEATQAWMCGCRRCCVYLKEPAPDGGRFVTRVAGAASVLAPLYVVYVTTQIIYSRTRDTRPQLTFEPTGEVKLYADKLGQLIERVLGYHPFPMEFANVPLPDIRVTYLNVDTPTLLNALLSDYLENLP